MVAKDGIPVESDPSHDSFRVLIDLAPALIHAARPDGYLDYFNQHWFEYEFGES
jgi:hypothetical protein